MGLEYCRIYTSFYFARTRAEPVQIGILPCLYFLLLLVSDWIGRLPYLYFLLLIIPRLHIRQDWKTAVFILPFTELQSLKKLHRLEDCRIYTSFYSNSAYGSYESDWKTAVFILPFTPSARKQFILGLEDCRIYTSFYYRTSTNGISAIGRLPYLYFLLLHQFH